MASDKLMNHTQGETIITKLTSIADSLDDLAAVTPAKLGMGIATCDTAASTAAKTAALANFALVEGAPVSVKFTYANTATNATLNINNTGAKPIIYKDVAIGNDVISAGDTCTFIYTTNTYKITNIDTLTGPGSGTVRQVGAENGLITDQTDNADIQTTGNIGLNLKSTTAFSTEVGAHNTSTDNMYPVALDSEGHPVAAVPNGSTTAKGTVQLTNTWPVTPEHTDDLPTTKLLDDRFDVDESNILYAVNKVGKNLVPLADQTIEQTGVSVSVKDGVVTVNGQSTITLTTIVLGTFTLPAGTYTISGGGDSATGSDFFMRLGKTSDDSYISYSSSTSPVNNFTLATATSVKLTILLNSSVGSVTNVPFYPMICVKDIYDQDSTFAPYGLSNIDLTKKFKYNLDNGVKNLIVISEKSISNLYGLEINRTPKGVTISGTATISFSLQLTGNLWDGSSQDPALYSVFSKLPNSVKLTGSPDSQEKNRIIVALYDSGTWVYSFSSLYDMPQDLSSYTYTRWYAYIPIVSGTSYSGTWYPMLRDASIMDETFAEGANPNSELTQLATKNRNVINEIIDTNVKNLIDFINGTRTDYNSTTSVSNNVLTITATGQYARTYQYVTVSKTGEYVIKCNITNRSIAQGVAKILISPNPSGTNAIAEKEITTDGNVKFEFNTTITSFYIHFYVSWTEYAATNTISVSNFLFCTDNMFDMDESYVPYAKPNYELTQLQAEDREINQYNLLNGIKNQLVLTGDTKNPNTVTVSWDYPQGTVRVVGSSATTGVVYIFLGYWTAPENGVYRIYGNSAACTSNIRIYDDADWTTYTGAGVNEKYFTKGSTRRIYLRIASGITVGDITVTPMICKKSVFDMNSDFVPGGIPNTIITPELIELVDNGPKNKLRYSLESLKEANPSESGYSWDGNSCTVQNVRFTVNSDLTITAKQLGSHSTNAIFNICHYTASEGDYLSGGYGTDYAYFYTRGGGASDKTSDGDSIGSPALGNDAIYALVVTATNTYTGDILFKPMVCTKTAWNISRKFTPPSTLPLTPTSRELIDIVDSGAKNIANFKSVTNLTVNSNGYTIAATGTPSSSSTQWVWEGQVSKSGNYVFAVAPTSGTLPTTALYNATDDVNVAMYASSVGGELVVYLTTGKTYKIGSYLHSGTAYSAAYNCMLCTKAAWDVSHKFVPFIPDSYTKVTQNIANSTTLYAKRNGRTVTINGYMDSISFTPNVASTIGTINDDIGKPLQQVRSVCNVGSNAYSIGEMAYLTITTEGLIRVSTANYSGTGSVYFSVSYTL